MNDGPPRAGVQGPRFKDLNHFHPSYNAERIVRNDLLYEGGDRIISEAKRFIDPQPHETDIAYRNRLKCSSYKNYFAQIIDSYVADLFSKQMTITTANSLVAGQPAMPKAPRSPGLVKSDSETQTDVPSFYRGFFDDADRRGNTIEQVLRELVSEALVHDEAFIGVDFPRLATMPQTLLDEERSGADRAYLYYIENEAVIDWELDENEEFNWLVIKTESTPKATPWTPRDRKVVRFKVWTKDPVSGGVSFSIYETTCKIDEEPEDNAALTLVDNGEVSFGCIPVLRLCLDEELQVGRLLATQCIDLFRRGSALLHAQNRSLFALLVFKQGAELPADGSLAEASQNSNRGAQGLGQAKNRGGIVIGPEDDVSFVEPDGRSYQIAHQGIQDDVDDLHRVTLTMAMGVKAMSSALGRSGQSKMQDNRAKEIVLSAFARVVKDFVKRLMSTVSEGRGESVAWNVIGMDSYRIVDRELLIEEAVQMGTIEIPSPTYQAHHLVRTATDLLDEDLSPDALLAIKAEIRDAVSNGWQPAALQAVVASSQAKDEGGQPPKSKKPSKKPPVKKKAAK